MRRASWLLAALVLPISFSAGNARAADDVLAIAPIHIEGLPPAQAESFADAVAGASAELFAVRVLDPGDVRALMKTAKPPLPATCDNAFCWARLGAAVEAAYVLAADGVTAEHQLVVSFKWVDVAAQRVTARVQVSLTKDVLTFASEMPAALSGLRVALPAALRRGGSTVSAPAVAPRPTPPEPTHTAPVAAPPEPTPAPPPPVPAPSVAPAAAKPGWAGMKYRSLDDGSASPSGLQPVPGVLVTQVVEGGPAASAGLQKDDVIQGCNGAVIVRTDDLKRLLAAGKAGDSFDLTLLRAGMTVHVTLVLRERPEAEGAAASAPTAGAATTGTSTSAAAATPPATEEPRQIHHEQTTYETDNKQGVGASHYQETITQVTKPLDRVITGTYNGGAGLVLSKIFNQFQLLGGVGVRFVDPEGDFPDKEGGTRHAFVLVGSANFFVSRTSYDLSSFGPGASSMDIPTQTQANIELTVAPAYGYFKFDSWDEATMTQNGWALTLGLALGIKAGKLPAGFKAETSFSGTGMPSFRMVEEKKSFGFVIKPLIGLEFPKYNPGTAAFSSFMISGFIWPFPFAASVTVGGTFAVPGL